MPARPRAALILPYWSFWEHAVPYALRAEREALLEQARAALAETIEIAVCAVVASREDGAALARAADAAGCEVLIALQTMASPPAYASAALDALPSTPVVVWTAHRHERLGADFSHADITTEGATVGTPMLTNVLVRRGRPFALVAGRIDDAGTQQRVAAAARAGAVAGGLRRARIGRVGRQLDGYDCVVADPGRLREATGIELVPIEPAEVRERYLAVDPSRVRALEGETRETFTIDASAEGETLARSLRAACAIEDLVRDHRLDAGAMNCHVPEIRFGAEIGIAPCFGLGRSTSAGVPVDVRRRRRHGRRDADDAQARRRRAVPRARVARLRDR